MILLVPDTDLIGRVVSLHGSPENGMQSCHGSFRLIALSVDLILLIMIYQGQDGLMGLAPGGSTIKSAGSQPSGSACTSRLTD